jgi:hypothetical protein
MAELALELHAVAVSDVVLPLAGRCGRDLGPIRASRAVAAMSLPYGSLGPSRRRWEEGRMAPGRTG